MLCSHLGRVWRIKKGERKSNRNEYFKSAIYEFQAKWQLIDFADIKHYLWQNDFDLSLLVFCGFSFRMTCVFFVQCEMIIIFINKKILSKNYLKIHL